MVIKMLGDTDTGTAAMQTHPVLCEEVKILDVGCERSYDTHRRCGLLRVS